MNENLDTNEELDALATLWKASSQSLKDNIEALLKYNKKRKKWGEQNLH